MDEQIVSFLSLTGGEDPKIAQYYLEMAGNSLETAVSLFLDGGGGPTSSAAGTGGDPREEIRAPINAFSEQIIEPGARRVDEKRERQRLDAEHRDMVQRLAFDRAGVSEEVAAKRTTGKKKGRLSKETCGKSLGMSIGRTKM